MSTPRSSLHLARGVAQPWVLVVEDVAGLRHVVVDAVAGTGALMRVAQGTAEALALAHRYAARRTSRTVTTPAGASTS